MVALYDALPHGEGGRWKGLGKTLLFDITCRLACRIPFTKLGKLDGDAYLYLAVLMVATLVQAGEALVILEGI